MGRHLSPLGIEASISEGVKGRAVGTSLVMGVKAWEGKYGEA